MTVYVAGSSGGTPSIEATRQFSGITDTLVIGDANNRVESTGASAATETLPNDSFVNFAPNTVIWIVQTGSGQVAVVGASGVTVNAPGGLFHTRTQFSSIAAFYEGSNVYTLSGDLA
jgi:hypothetical protein